jgi:hypothetical protein
MKEVLELDTVMYCQVRELGKKERKKKRPLKGLFIKMN